MQSYTVIFTEKKLNEAGVLRKYRNNSRIDAERLNLGNVPRSTQIVADAGRRQISRVQNPSRIRPKSTKSTKIQMPMLTTSEIKA